MNRLQLIKQRAKLLQEKTAESFQPENTSLPEAEIIEQKKQVEDESVFVSYERTESIDLPEISVYSEHIYIKEAQTISPATKERAKRLGISLIHNGSFTAGKSIHGTKKTRAEICEDIKSAEEEFSIKTIFEQNLIKSITTMANKNKNENLVFFVTNCSEFSEARKTLARYKRKLK